MKQHQVRVLALGLLVLSTLIGIIVLSALGQSSGTGFGVLTGAFGIALPGFMDAIAVETRRRKPGVAAIADDVEPPLQVRADR